MKRYIPFGETLSIILMQQGISRTELARRMGLKSKTSLLRVLSGNCTFQTTEAFYRKLLAGRCLAMTDEDKAALARGMVVSRMGEDGCRVSEAMWTLVSSAVDPTPIAVEGIPGVRTFDELAQLYANARECHLLLAGLCDRRISEGLARVMNKPDFHGDCLHFMIPSLGKSVEIVRCVAAAMPMLYEPAYQAYSVDDERVASELPGLLRSDILLARFVDEAGKQHQHMLVRTNTNLLRGVPAFASESFDFIAGLLYDMVGRLRPMKRAFDVRNTLEDYVAYTEQYRLLEYNRDVFSIKPDVPINFIDPDLLNSVVTDGLAQVEFTEPVVELRSLVDRLYVIQRKRFDNFVYKRHATHCIFSRPDMLNFALTGKQTDHFFGMRPYTPKERVQILRTIRDMAANNHFFYIYFAKPGALRRDLEITLFDGIGVLFTDAHTAYDLSGTHGELVLEHDDFATGFKKFFLKELLAEHVLTAKESLACLDELIEVAQTAK